MKSARYMTSLLRKKRRGPNGLKDRMGVICSLQALNEVLYSMGLANEKRYELIHWMYKTLRLDYGDWADE